MNRLYLLAIVFATIVLAACGGKPSPQSHEKDGETKRFEQEQIEASIKLHLDSIAAEIGRLGQFPFLAVGEDGMALTNEEKRVKPNYLLDPDLAGGAATLSEMYRMLSALTVDERVAALYEMPTENYEKAIAKLLAGMDDSSFDVLKEDEGSIYEISQDVYDAMEKNGRINYFWQLASAALVEQLYVLSQNTNKFLSVFDDQAATNVTFRLIVVLDAVERLAQYDPEIQLLVEALSPLKVLDATSVDELRSQLATAQKDINHARILLFH